MEALLERKLVIVTQTAVLATALIVSAVLGKAWFTFHHRPPSDNATGAFLRTGMTLSAPNQYMWPGDKNTLILAVKYGCTHCDKDMDFYRELAERSPAVASRTAIVSMFPDDEFVAKHDLDTHGVTGQPIIANVDLAKLHVEGTPTLILVNGKGIVLLSWIGELMREQEQDVLEAVGQNSSGPS